MPIERDTQREPTDSIYAFADGIVRYVNRNASASSYGRYMVIEHPEIASGFVSLYAHLSSVPDAVVAGVSVVGGQTIARMGRSASYAIPKSRAHLHFELGVWLGPDFQRWYDRQPFNSRNEHGAYNGLNIVGIDVWAFWNAYVEGEAESALSFMLSEPIAITVDVPDARRPELLGYMPELLMTQSIPSDIGGWRIGFTWYGVPVSWTPLTEFELESNRVEIVEADGRTLSKLKCDDMVSGEYISRPGPRLSSVLSRLFLK